MREVEHKRGLETVSQRRFCSLFLLLERSSGTTHLGSSSHKADLKEAEQVEEEVSQALEEVVSSAASSHVRQDGIGSDPTAVR